MNPPRPRSLTPWAWIPSLYLAEGLPYVIVMSVSVIMFKALGLSNTKVALYTSWLYLPWTIKPLWSPVVDLLQTRRWWIWMMQFLIGAGLAGVALSLPAPGFVQASLAFLWLLGFSSATHDIAADGFYLLATSEQEQAYFVGIRNTFYRLATIAGQGLLVMLAGWIQQETNDPKLGWIIAFGAAAGAFGIFGLYHASILPRPASDRHGTLASATHFFADFGRTFIGFFQKPKIAASIAFLLLYRFAEAQLVKMVAPFLMDPRETGGLGLSTTEVGLIYGTIGVAALLVGGILGGMLVARRGLRFWIWPMVCVMHLPDAVFVYLAHTQPESRWLIGAGVALEQFGYGFGFAAYMLYMIRIARGPHQTAHYAICTGFMALGMMVPGMWSGALQEWLGYPRFFIWVLLATIPGFAVVALVPTKEPDRKV
jgi:PAT family beta-lactamase induction signal transducer AmpG